MNISIIITCFNKELSIKNTIEKTLCQINNQTQIVVIDDASTDSSASIISQYEKQISFIPLKKNIGVLNAIKIGIKAAKNEIIVLLDGDDILAENAIEILKKAFFKFGKSVAIYSYSHKMSYENLTTASNKIKTYNIVQKFSPAYKITRARRVNGTSISFYREDFLNIKDEFPPILIQDHIIPCLLSYYVNDFYEIDAVTHYAGNVKNQERITQNPTQMGHDKLEFFFTAYKKENNFWHKINFKRKLFKRFLLFNKKFNLKINNIFIKILFGITSNKKLINLKNEIQFSMRKIYNIKYYGN